MTATSNGPSVPPAISVEWRRRVVRVSGQNPPAGNAHSPESGSAKAEPGSAANSTK